MNVAHFESGTLPRQPARAEGAESSFMRGFRQRVGLVHELGELAGAEKFLDHRRNRFRVDQIVGHQRVDLLQTHTFLDGAFHAHQADAILVLEQLAHRPHPAIAEMIDVVDDTLSVPELDQGLGRQQDIFFTQNPQAQRGVDAKSLVDLQTADTRKVVVIGLEKQVVDKILGHFRGSRITRSQPAVDLDQRFFLALDLVDQKRLADRVAGRHPVDEKHIKLVDPSLFELGQIFFVDGVVGLDDRQRGLGVVYGMCENPVDKILHPDRDGLRTDGLKSLDCAHRKNAALFNQHFTGFRIFYVVVGTLPFKEFGVKLFRDSFALDQYLLTVVKICQQVFHAESKSFKENRDRKFPAPVDPDVDDVLRIDFHVDPGPSHGYDPGAVNDFPARMGLAFVVIEEDP